MLPQSVNVGIVSVFMSYKPWKAKKSLLFATKSQGDFKRSFIFNLTFSFVKPVFMTLFKIASKIVNFVNSRNSFFLNCVI